jgi:FkbM family methyltransferase
MFHRAIAAVGIASALRLEFSRLVYRLGLTRVAPLFGFLLPNSNHKLYLRTGTSDYNVFFHVFVLKAYGPSLPSDCSPKLIIDCGANVGYSSMYFLSRFPEVTLVAVEPEPGNMGICEMNLASYGVRAILSKAAVWSRPCTLELVSLGPHSEQSTRVVEWTGSQAATVPAIDVPSLIKLGGGQSVDLLKVDIEGSELEIFSKGSEAWLPKVRNIAIELHGPECGKAFFSALASYDYDLVTFEDTTICRNIVSREAVGAAL